MNFQNPLPSDDSLRAVLDTVLSSSAYQWTDTEPRLSWLARWWGILVDWLGRFRDSNPVAADILFWSLVALLVLIFMHGGWIMYRTVREATAADGRSGSTGILAIRDERWFQRVAETLAAEGRFAEAMHAAFTALVLRLDARGILQYHPGKTPREYSREARLAADARTDLQGVVGDLYAHAYAGRPCGREQYDAWLLGLKRDWHAAQN